MSNLNMVSLDQCIKDAHERCENSIASNKTYYEKQRDSTIAQVERNRPLIAMLDAEGFDVDVGWTRRGDEFYIRLGFFPSTKAGNAELADKLRAIRKIIDCKFGKVGKSLDSDSKNNRHRVKFTIEPPDVPGMEISYTRRLPKGSKCKVVTQRSTYRSLVCGV